MDMKTHQHHNASPPAKPSSPTDLKDPVCGMTVTEQSDHKLMHEGRPYYFCSAKCQGKFAANPLQYLAPAPPVETTPAAVGTIYTCPMHPEIRQDHPG
ncbi:MAG: YHS domain-containing protein, partial [Polaromonas sp.]|nr:YHS domain-containing protein [Polaromonas sp.]